MSPVGRELPFSLGIQRYPCLLLLHLTGLSLAQREEPKTLAAGKHFEASSRHSCVADENRRLTSLLSHTRLAGVRGKKQLLTLEATIRALFPTGHTTTIHSCPKSEGTSINHSESINWEYKNGVKKISRSLSFKRYKNKALTPHIYNTNITKS